MSGGTVPKWVKRYELAKLDGRVGVVTQSPDSDGDIKLRWSDGDGHSGYVEAARLQKASKKDQRRAVSWCKKGSLVKYLNKVAVVQDDPDGNVEVKLRWVKGGKRQMRDGHIQAARLQKASNRDQLRVVISWCKKGIAVRLPSCKSKVGVVTMNPDKDAEVKVRWNDGTTSGYIRAARLLTVQIDHSPPTTPPATPDVSSSDDEDEEPVVVPDKQEDEEVIVSEQVHHQSRGKTSGGICYAVAAATGIRAALRKKNKDLNISDETNVPGHEELVKLIVTDRRRSILRRYYDSQRVYKPDSDINRAVDDYSSSWKELGAKLKSEHGAELEDGGYPTKAVEYIASTMPACKGLRAEAWDPAVSQWDSRRGELVASFFLSEDDWNTFSKEYGRSSHRDLQLLKQQPKLPETKPNGHAVAVYKRHVADDGTVIWQLKNSWGEEWGQEGGYFSSIEGQLPLEFTEVWYEKSVDMGNNTTTEAAAKDYGVCVRHETNAIASRHEDYEGQATRQSFCSRRQVATFMDARSQNAPAY
eukprot:COSAG02_NODE_6447_length_3564_cov_1.635786_1_plen_528_part_10